MTKPTPDKGKSPNYERLDKQHLWHPFTQMKEWMESPQLVIERGRGVYLYDTQGKKYLDGVSSLWANVHGHSHPIMVKAIRRQLDRLDHSTLLGLTNIPAVQLARKLVDLTPPDLTRVFFSDDGATAVEIALKMSFQYWRQKGNRRPVKKKFIAFSNAYHGDTLGSVSVGGVRLFHEVFRPLLFPTIKVAYPFCYRCPLGKQPPHCEIDQLKEVEGVLRNHHRQVCGLVVEPMIQGAGGMVPMPSGFLAGLAELTRRFGVHLILDEVATGFGRTGKFFALEHEGIQPDFLALAKGITGGTLPLAATLTTDEIFESFLGEYAEFKSFFHGHTYTGNPLACAAALANLEIFEKERTLQKLQLKIAYLKKALMRLWELPCVGDVRQMGFMVGIELVRDRSSKEPFPLGRRMGQRVVVEARQRGVLLRPLGNTIVLMPPLSITRAQLKKLVEVTYNSIQAASQGE
jgi:adenosylmethionine-8-amino-7-oxononanoate aminotransferase